MKTRLSSLTLLHLHIKQEDNLVKESFEEKEFTCWYPNLLWI